MRVHFFRFQTSHFRKAHGFRGRATFYAPAQKASRDSAKNAPLSAVILRLAKG
jgi:hypothetical protein